MAILEKNMSGPIGKLMVVLIIVFAYSSLSSESFSADNSNSVAPSINKFAFDLYGKLKGNEGNLFFSPYSISSALAMTYAGARGDTEKQMAEVLHFELGQNIHPLFSELAKKLTSKASASSYQLYIANALWGQEGYPFLEDFIELNRKFYGAGLHAVDFIGGTEEARKTINRWTEEKTEEKIKELIKPGVLDVLTRLVLTNAIYFKGNWATQFDKEATKDLAFHLTEGEKKDVPTMYQMGEFSYMQTEAIECLALPYGKGDLSMVILLPREIDNPSSLEENLSPANLEAWLSSLRKQEVNVYLPRFKVEAAFALKEQLTLLGMSDAFSDEADFSGIDGTQKLKVTDVIHKAFVTVDEEGTEAAAATAVVVAIKAIVSKPIFRADHPFVFLIRDNQSGCILFLGRVVDPTKG